MAYKSKPVQYKSKKKTESISRKDMSRRATSSAPTISKNQIMEIKKIQSAVDLYNNVEIYEIDPYFQSIELTGSWVIVRLFYENLIKYIDESNPEDIQLDAWYRQIDARERTSDNPKWIPTPFPYIELGVIVAISPELQLRYAKRNNELKAHGLPEVHIPQVGDTIEVRSNYNSAWFKEQRYYTNKQEQCMDFVRNQNEIRLNYFNSYFRLEDYDFFSVIHTDKQGFFMPDKPEWYDAELETYTKQRQDIINEIEKAEAEANQDSDEDDIVIEIE